MLISQLFSKKSSCEVKQEYISKMNVSNYDQAQNSVYFLSKLQNNLAAPYSSSFSSSSPFCQSDTSLQGTVQDIIQKWFTEGQRRESISQTQECEEKIKKLEEMLIKVLQSGNIDMAMMLIAQIETKQTQGIVKQLSANLNQTQQQRRDLSSQLADLQNKKDNQKPGDLTQIQNKLQDVGDQIQMITMMIKDLNEQKNRMLEMANSHLSNENQSKMSIVRNR